MPKPTLEKVYIPTTFKRRLQAIAFDPSLGLGLESVRINQVTILVPWESLDPGPVDG